MKGLPFQPFAAIRRQSKRLAAGLPWDLIGVVCFAAAATALITILEVSSPLVRAAVGLPLLFLAPGYVTVSMLFPRATDVRDSTADTRIPVGRSRELTDVERAALSFGMSFAVLPLLGLAIITSSWALTGSVVAFFVTCFVAAGAVVAAVRRLLVPASERYRVGFRSRFEAARASLFDRESTLHAAVNVALVLSMIIAVTAVGYGLVSPHDAEQYTDLQLLTENESGELVSAGYPEDLEPDEAVPLVVALDNREGEAVNYTVIVQQQRVEDGDVVERTELQRFDTAVDDGETAEEEVTLRPTATGDDVRLSVLVFTDDVPETPTYDDAYRYGHVWTTATADSDVGADTDLESGSGEDETDSGGDTDADENETDGGDEIDAGNETDSPDGGENESDDADEDDPFDFGDDDDPLDFGDDNESDDGSGGDADDGADGSDSNDGNESDGSDDSSDDTDGDTDGDTSDDSSDDTDGDTADDSGDDTDGDTADDSGDDTDGDTTDDSSDDTDGDTTDDSGDDTDGDTTDDSGDGTVSDDSDDSDGGSDSSDDG